MQLEGSRNY